MIKESGKPSDGALLHLAGVSRRYGDYTALHPTDLQVAPGECVALMGPNGSGKSTLLRIAAGRDEPTTGSVTFDGRRLVEEDLQARARIAVVGDSSGCYPDLTVREHLMLVAVGHGVGDPGSWVDWALADRHLGEKADALPSSLSSGQLQALLLASALVRPRDLLILDEPEQRLDPGARKDLATRIAAETGDRVAVLLATHHTDLAHAVADRVLLLDDGRVVGEGAPADVLGAPPGSSQTTPPSSPSSPSKSSSKSSSKPSSSSSSKSSSSKSSSRSSRPSTPPPGRR